MQPDVHSRTLPATPRFSRRAWPVAAVGALGLLSLLLKPVPVALLGAAPELAALPPLAQRAALLANRLSSRLAKAALVVHLMVQL